MRKKIALIFGGRSLESDISVITAMQALAAVDTSKYIVEPVYMYEGDFYVRHIDNIKAFVDFNVSEHKKVLLYKGAFYLVKRNTVSKYFKPDCALLCCHGGEGENGVLQSVLQYNGIPFTSAGVLQSSVGMDKTFLKRIFESLILNVLPYTVITRSAYKANADENIAKIEERLEYPLIVKPSSQGSSIGIEVANDRAQLDFALKVAFSFDDEALVEHKLTDFIEVNCAAYRYKDEIVLSSTEQPIFDSEYLTFDDKYMSGGKMSGGGHIIPANIGDLNNTVRETTRLIYDELNLSGVVRVDYLVDLPKGKVYVNEINTIPGSMAFYLFESLGITFEKLLSDLIDNAIYKGIETRKVYKSNVLSHFARGGKIAK